MRADFLLCVTTDILLFCRWCFAGREFDWDGVLGSSSSLVKFSVLRKVRFESALEGFQERVLWSLSAKMVCLQTK